MLSKVKELDNENNLRKYCMVLPSYPWHYECQRESI